MGGEEEGEVPGESPALEVMLQDNDLGFFGGVCVCSWCVCQAE